MYRPVAAPSWSSSKARFCPLSLFWSSAQADERVSGAISSKGGPSRGKSSKVELQDLFKAAIAAADPARCLPPFLPPLISSDVTGRTIVIAAGKAAASMSATLAAHYPGRIEGFAVTRDGHRTGAEIPGIEVFEAGHPLADARSVAAGDRALMLAGSVGHDDRVIVLLSGGASALLESPLPGLQLADLAAINRKLLAAGADIHSINAVRKRLSAIKGGRLARAIAPASTWLFAISDVAGDRLADIGSGPCSPDDSDPAEVDRILREIGVTKTAAIGSALGAPPGPSAEDKLFERIHTRIVARPADAVDAVAAVACRAGWQTLNLGAEVNGSAHAVAAEHARLALELATRGGRHAIVSGGETTVRVRNSEGRGGRNTEYALALAIALDGAPGIWALAADTDGIDGTGDHAGAFVMPDTLHRAARKGLSPAAMLAQNQSGDFFAILDDLFVPGPTLTNVNDMRIILIDNNRHDAAAPVG
jgi:glycerate 2-kinase